MVGREKELVPHDRELVRRGTREMCHAAGERLCDVGQPSRARRRAIRPPQLATDAAVVGREIREALEDRRTRDRLGRDRVAGRRIDVRHQAGRERRRVGDAQLVADDAVVGGEQQAASQDDGRGSGLGGRGIDGVGLRADRRDRDGARRAAVGFPEPAVVREEPEVVPHGHCPAGIRRGGNRAAGAIDRAGGEIADDHRPERGIRPPQLAAAGAVGGREVKEIAGRRQIGRKRSRILDGRQIDLLDDDLEAVEARDPGRGFLCQPHVVGSRRLRLRHGEQRGAGRVGQRGPGAVEDRDPHAVESGAGSGVRPHDIGEDEDFPAGRNVEPEHVGIRAPGPAGEQGAKAPLRPRLEAAPQVVGRGPRVVRPGLPGGFRLRRPGRNPGGDREAGNLARRVDVLHDPDGSTGADLPKLGAVRGDSGDEIQLPAMRRERCRIDGRPGKQPPEVRNLGRARGGAVGPPDLGGAASVRDEEDVRTNGGESPRRRVGDARGGVGQQPRARGGAVGHPRLRAVHAVVGGEINAAACRSQPGDSRGRDSAPDVGHEHRARGVGFPEFRAARGIIADEEHRRSRRGHSPLWHDVAGHERRPRRRAVRLPQPGSRHPRNVADEIQRLADGGQRHGIGVERHPERIQSGIEIGDEAGARGRAIGLPELPAVHPIGRGEIGDGADHDGIGGSPGIRHRVDVRDERRQDREGEPLLETLHAEPMPPAGAAATPPPEAPSPAPLPPRE